MSGAELPVPTRIHPIGPEQHDRARRTAARYCAERDLGADDLAELLDALGVREERAA